MKKVILIPKFFHELFGTEQRLSELILILIFTVTATLVTALSTTTYWQSLSGFQNFVLWLLFLDISGGVVANLSFGTNNHYKELPKGRWLFIAVHIQPLILAAVLQSPMLIAIVIWLYTVLSASLINCLRQKIYHRLLAGALYSFAIIGYVLSDISLPSPISLIYLLYMMKVIYSFSVDHSLEV